MDSAFTTSVFRALFSSRAAGCLRALPARCQRLPPTTWRSSVRLVSYSRRATKKQLSNESAWQQRKHSFPSERNEEFMKYPMVTAKDLAFRQHRPREVRMLLRDFIEDSLYNPSYGYFSKEAVIFQSDQGFDFNSMRTEFDFTSDLARRYAEFEDGLDKEEPNDARQLWHTPTELFKPYYGEAIAQYLVSNYGSNLYPYHDLLIYEMGAGNGTLMLNILDYIRAEAPEVYERTKFRVIEVSSNLAQVQKSRVMRTAENRGHAAHIEIINRSIFDWDTHVPSPCFFLALEVFDNFAHDALRFHPSTEQPVQSNVVIDRDNNMYEYFSRTLDPLASRFLAVRDAACSSPSGPVFDHPLRMPRALRRLRQALPFAHNLTIPEYIPTRLLQFFDTLDAYFPAHRLVTSDFHTLPDAVTGVNAPVVQTRYQRRTIAVSTPLVHQGYFDILFPTDFAVIRALYQSVTGKPARVSSHGDFLEQWADVGETRVRDGDNPMLNWYKNASVMVTA